MRRIIWTLAPIAVGALLLAAGATAQAAPTPVELPELLLKAPRRAKSAARVEQTRPERKLDLGDYNLPGERAGQPTAYAPAGA